MIWKKKINCYLLDSRGKKPHNFHCCFSLINAKVDLDEGVGNYLSTANM